MVWIRSGKWIDIIQIRPPIIDHLLQNWGAFLILFTLIDKSKLILNDPAGSDFLGKIQLFSYDLIVDIIVTGGAAILGIV